MEEIREKIERAVNNLFGVSIVAEVVSSPENIAKDFGADYSSNVALKLAKDLRRSPIEIAEMLQKELPEATVSKPGFLNFKISDEILREKVEKLTEGFSENISQDEYSGQIIICEFSDPNPFKVLHVGHLYTSVVGDAISRLFEYAGAKVIRANFGGDVGLHVGKTIYALCKGIEAKTSLAFDDFLTTKTEDLGDVAKDLLDHLTIEQIAACYVAGTRAYEEDEDAKIEITKLNKEIYKINEKKVRGYFVADLYWRGRELSYDYFKDFYARIGLKFDKFYPESEVANLGLSKVLEEEKAGVYEKSAGAIVFDGEKYGLHTRVFVNKEGVPTYEAKDVGLIFTKWDDYHFDKSVVITGNEQLEYMKVVLKSIEQYAPELVAKTSHLTHGLVKLPGNVKMSSRKGNFLRAVDVLDLITDELRNMRDASASEIPTENAAVTAEVSAENAVTTTEAGKNVVDPKIVLAATKYAFLKYKMGGNIVFDPKESVKMTGNSGPYLLYSAVRAKKILEKVNGAKWVATNVFSKGLRLEQVSQSGMRKGVMGGTPSEEPLTSSERELVKKLLQYKNVLSEAVSEMAPHKVAGFLYELSQEFSRFYENCPVKGSQSENFRVKLVTLFTEVIYHGMNILGIEIPEKM